MKIFPGKLLAAKTTFLFFLSLFVTVNSFSQEVKVITGKVTDDKGVPLSNATVKLKGTVHATRTNGLGVFSLPRSSANNSTLVVSFVGYADKEVSVPEGESRIPDIILTAKTNELDQVVVTGVFDKRTRMQASIAITTLTPKIFDKLTPVSAADLLKNVPGVYVNSSLGEIRNTVYSRGVSVGSNDGASGYYYVSMQEDGLPVTNSTFGNYGPDYFLRVDATLGRLEAVRGGTASILGANAPGGIFNYISKEGGDSLSGEVRTKYGLEANGHSNFYRADFNIGGPLGKSWYFDAGGFYRYDQGNHIPQTYPMNNGGQFKGNIVKRYKTGSIKIYAKYLNDHNGWFEFTPTFGFTDPKPAAGFSNISSVLSPAIKQTFLINQTGKEATYDNSSLVHSIDKTIGFNIDQRFGNGWTFNNAMRYSNKASTWNTNAVVYPLDMSSLISYAILGVLGSPGTYHVTNLLSGQPLLTVQSYSGYDFNTSGNNLPGNNVAPYSLFFEPLLYQTNSVKEFTDQFSFNKKLKNMGFNLGGFYSNTQFSRTGGTVGLGLGTVQPQPELVNINRTNPDGSISQLTTSNGSLGTGSTTGFTLNNATQSDLALFFGHNWQIIPALNLDWGARFESLTSKGTNTPGLSTPDTTGGLDHNTLTLYDNSIASAPTSYNYNKTVNTLSYSFALNYKVSNSFAIYGRYSQGNKAPDLDMYMNANTTFLIQTLNPIAQRVSQFETGIKYRTRAFDLFVTPYYSLLSHVANIQTFDTSNSTGGLGFYSKPITYEKYRTYGVEIESNYRLGDHFDVRGVFTFQNSIAVDYSTWIQGATVAKDSLSYFSGNKTDNSANAIINVTPAYHTDKFYAQLTWAYMGKREANVANAFYLPAFSQFNLAAGYDITKRLRLSIDINNLFNTYGVMSWSRPGSFLDALNRQSFTKADYEAAVKNNTEYSTVGIPARAYFLTATFKF